MSALAQRAAAFIGRYNTEQGTPCEIYTGEEGVSQDDYGSVIGTPAPTLSVTAYPLRWDPSLKELADAGIVESVDAIAYFPAADVDYNVINTAFARVNMLGETLRVKSKHRKDLHGLWTVLALVRQ